MSLASRARATRERHAAGPVPDQSKWISSEALKAMWRLSLLGGILTGFDESRGLVPALVVAFLLSLVWGTRSYRKRRLTHAFPVLSLLLRPCHSMWHHMEAGAVRERIVLPDPDERPTYLERPTIERATRRGRPSPWQSAAMEPVDLSAYPRLHRSEASDLAGTFGERGAVGAAGEEQFLQALARRRCASGGTILEDLEVYTSLRMVSDDGTAHIDPSRRDDLDVVILGDQGAIVVDVKLYSSGDVRYATHREGDDSYLDVIDVATGSVVSRAGGGHKQGWTMATATRRLRDAGLRVESYVVIMPGPMGEGDVSTLADCPWPGGVRAIGPDALLERISHMRTARRSADWLYYFHDVYEDTLTHRR